MTLFSPPQLLNSQRWRNMRVGILGGSFNPPHEGHIHISQAVLKSLHLDAIWWLVTPQNPLKSAKDLLPLDKRVALCRAMIKHPKILVTDLERDLGTSYTYDSIKQIKKAFPHTQFAWITGMDNALNLHKWDRWKDLLDEITMVHITRFPPVKLIRNCPNRMLSSQNHVILPHGGHVPLSPRTSYWLLQKRVVNISSTEIRKKQNKSK